MDLTREIAELEDAVRHLESGNWIAKGASGIDHMKDVSKQRIGQLKARIVKLKLEQQAGGRGD